MTQKAKPSNLFTNNHLVKAEVVSDNASVIDPIIANATGGVMSVELDETMLHDMNFGLFVCVHLPNNQVLFLRFNEIA